MRYLFIPIFILGLWACNSKGQTEDSTPQNTPLVVGTIEITHQKFNQVVKSTGMLASKSEIRLAFKTGGMIKRSYVSEGQYVKAGQLLAELDLSEIDAQVNQADFAYQKAKRDYERAESLYEDEAVTRTVLSDAKSGLDIASQTLNTAKFNQKLSKIYAPVSGRILMKLAEQGELIGPFVPMFILGSGAQSYVVNVGLTDRDIVKINLGDKASVQLDAYPGETFEGSVTQIAQMITPSTGTYDIEVQINAPGKKLISGFVAQVEITTKSLSVGLVVPAEALVNAHGNQADIYVYSGGKALKKTVTIGQIMNGMVTVSTGVDGGETVITLGSGFVSDGDLVTVNNEI